MSVGGGQKLIRTVLGDMPADLLGKTLAHEHVYIDYRCAWSPPSDELSYLVDSKVSTSIIDIVRNNAHHSLDNLILNNEDEAVSELTFFKQAGGNAVIALSSGGLHQNVLGLKNIAQRTGLQIITGCGYYRYIAFSDDELAMSSEQMQEEIVRSVNVGIGDSGIRAGIIGEVGTSYPLHPFEERSLIASARAQIHTGVSINVHPEVWEHGHIDVLNILEKAGADMTRIVMSHMDELIEPDWCLSVAQRGVYISFDTFGSEFVCDGIEEPKDHDRIYLLLYLLDKGYEDKIVISHDICYKIQLKKYGGRGYDHILNNVLPELVKRGVNQTVLDKILVNNPKHLLSINT